MEASTGCEHWWRSFAFVLEPWGSEMHIDRVGAERFIAMLGFTLSFLFLLAIAALGFTEGVSHPQASQADAYAAHR
jgi:hypothetical protein